MSFVYICNFCFLLIVLIILDLATFKHKVIDGDNGIWRENTVMWNQIAVCMRKLANEVFRELKRERQFDEETCWRSVGV